jgi:hypothetical protein
MYKVTFNNPIYVDIDGLPSLVLFVICKGIWRLRMSETTMSNCDEVQFACENSNIKSIEHVKPTEL